jgi:hypothetical protein
VEKTVTPGLKMVKEEKPLLDQFTCSFSGLIMRVEYSLKFFVKHKAWNDFGEGKHITVPIRILSRHHDV